MAEHLFCKQGVGGSNPSTGLKMIIPVKFYKQEKDYDCGPTALKMVLDYLDKKEYNKEDIQNLVDSEKSGVTWTLGLAKCAAQMGFDVEFYSKNLGFNPENYELEFYKKNTEENQSEEKLEKLKKESIEFGVKLREKSLNLNEILEKINENNIAIILLDWSKIRKIDQFIGHFLVIGGYDDKNIYVHNQGKINPKENLQIPKELFEEARKSIGTDEDIIFIKKKTNLHQHN